MKKNYLLYVILIGLLCACGETKSDAISLNGEIEGLGNDTLYIYGADKMHDRIDTLVAKDGRFAATLQADTLVATMLLFSDGTVYPIYLDKGEKIEIKGNANQRHALQVSGNRHNELLTRFNQELKELGTPSQRVLEEKADTFINQHPASLTSIHLLDKYFVRTQQPNLTRIKKLTDRMTGELKDRPYIQTLLERINKDENLMVGKTVPYFHLRNAEGKDITRTTMKDQYILLHFWASWDTISRSHNAMMRRIHKSHKKNKDLAMVGVSLDLDKERWKEAIKTDTLEWEQTCDFAGWNGDVIDKLAIRRIPANLFISPTGKIEGKDLNEEDVAKRLEEIKEEKKKKEEREKKRKREEEMRKRRR